MANRSLSSILIPAGIFILAGVLYAQLGFRGWLLRDDGLYLYEGQQMAKGIPPYVSSFDMKGPLPPMIAAAGVVISNMIGKDDLHTVRILFFIFGCLTVAMIYEYGRSAFDSKLAGWFSALVFLTFYPFAKAVGNGPAPKIPMVLFETLSLLFMGRKNWFWAAFFGSLCFLIWQPMAIFAVIAAMLAMMERGKRLKGSLLAVAGGLLPLVTILIYFATTHSTRELIDGLVLFPFRFLSRKPVPLNEQFTHPFEVLFSHYATSLILILIGFVMIAVSSFQRFEYIRKDHLVPIWLTLPFPLVLSFMDFQSYPDLYVFLPYVAIGAGGFVAWACNSFRKTMIAGIAAALLFYCLFDYRLQKSNALEDQLEGVKILQAQFGADMRMISIGVPESLALMHLDNPTPYDVINSGVDRLIHARVTGGFEGWIEQLNAQQPNVILLGPIEGKHIPKLMNWLQTNFRYQQIGPWDAYIKK